MLELIFPQLHMASLSPCVVLLLTITALLGVRAQMLGSIEVDGSNLLFVSPDPSGSFFFNDVDLFAWMAQLEVWNCCTPLLALSLACRIALKTPKPRQISLRLDILAVLYIDLT